MRTISPDQLPSSVLETSYMLGKLIAGTRKARGISQQALSESANIGRSTLVEIEHGSPRVQFVYWLIALEELGLIDTLTKGISATSLGVLANAVPRSREGR